MRGVSSWSKKKRMSPGMRDSVSAPSALAARTEKWVSQMRVTTPGPSAPIVRGDHHWLEDIGTVFGEAVQDAEHVETRRQTLTVRWRRSLRAGDQGNREQEDASVNTIHGRRIACSNALCQVGESRPIVT